MAMLDFFRAKRTAVAAAASPEIAPLNVPRPAMRGGVRGLGGMFQGEHDERLSSSWGKTPMSADSVIQKHQCMQVALSRQQAQENDYAKAFLRMCRQNIVGPAGVTMQAGVTKENGKLDKPVNDALEAGWSAWGARENCDVTGKRSWRGIVLACVNTAAKDGEFMVRMVWGKDAGPWGFALQTLDPQRCPVNWNQPRVGDGGNFIRFGIEFNRYGRPVAYYFTATTEDSEATFFYGGTPHIRIPAAEIIHGFREDMEGQKRGLPWMNTSLFRMRHLHGMEDAAVMNARVGAAKMGFIQWKEGFGPQMEDGDAVPEISAEAGVFETLPEGAEMVKWDPQYPASEFAPFTKYMLRGIAAGMGVPYNELAADLEGVNFSSIRQGTLDSREHWKDCQEWLIEQLVLPVFGAWLEYSLLANRLGMKGRTLQAAKVDKYRAVTWQARRWEWIDPRADTDAAVNKKNNFLTSAGRIIREQGMDPQTVWAESARDMAAQRDALIAEGFPKEKAEELVMLSMGRPVPKPVPEPKAKNEEPAAAA